MIHAKIQSIRKHRNGSISLEARTEGGTKISLSNRFYRGAERGRGGGHQILAVNTPKQMPAGIVVGDEILFSVSREEQVKVKVNDDPYFGDTRFGHSRWTTEIRPRQKEIAFWITKGDWENPEPNSEVRRDFNRARNFWLSPDNDWPRRR